MGVSRARAMCVLGFAYDARKTKKRGPSNPNTHVAGGVTGPGGGIARRIC